MAYKIKGKNYTGSFTQSSADALVRKYKAEGYKVDTYRSRKHYKMWYGVIYWKPEEVKKLAQRRVKRTKK